MQTTVCRPPAETQSRELYFNPPELTALFEKTVEKPPIEAGNDRAQEQVAGAIAFDPIRLRDPIVSETPIAQIFLQSLQTIRTTSPALTKRGDVKRRKEVVSRLMAGMAHHYNNILMGIWGNASLAKALISSRRPSRGQFEALEKTIQDGAFLLHLMLGYYGDRSMDARRIRIKQLLHQALLCESSEYGQFAFQALMTCRKRFDEPKTIAASMSRVLALLFRNIETRVLSIEADGFDQARIQQRLDAICDLVKRGHRINTHLLRYAAECSPIKRPIHLGPCIQRQIRRVLQSYPSISVQYRITPRMPKIKGDPEAVEWAMAQLIDNACEMMGIDGSLNLTVKPLYAEAPDQRCVVHAARDYLVVAIKDKGPGISRGDQRRIFDPFFSTSVKRTSLGLGLSAVNSIVRSHGGYIQLKSTLGKGSCFRVYLPVAGS